MTETRARLASQNASASNAMLLTEVLVKLGDMDRRLIENSADTKEARDLALRVNTTIEAQKLGERIAKIENVMAKNPEAVRRIVSDAIISTSIIAEKDLKALRADAEQQEKRILSLEDDRAHMVGAHGVWTGIRSITPTIISVFAAIMSAIIAALGYFRVHH